MTGLLRARVQVQHSQCAERTRRLFLSTIAPAQSSRSNLEQSRTQAWSSEPMASIQKAFLLSSALWPRVKTGERKPKFTRGLPFAQCFACNISPKSLTTTNEVETVTVFNERGWEAAEGRTAWWVTEPDAKPGLTTVLYWTHYATDSQRKSNITWNLLEIQMLGPTPDA